MAAAPHSPAPLADETFSQFTRGNGPPDAGASALPETTAKFISGPKLPVLAPIYGDRDIAMG